MKLRPAFFLLIIFTGSLLPTQGQTSGTKPEAAPQSAPQSAPEATPEAQPAAKPKLGPHLPSLPAAVSGNAVAVSKSRGTTLLFSFMGIGAKKTWDSVTNSAFYLDPDWDQWYPLKSVPGTVGRIGAAAISARGNIYLLGGAVVDNKNRSIIVSDVNAYDPQKEYWTRGEDMPTPVADAVIGDYRDRYIYLIGGRTDNTLEAIVQVYDAEKNKWMQGTPLPGSPVFGHAGAILDDTIVIVDGANFNPDKKPVFLASDQCWLGKIDRRDPTKIEWTKLPPHPGTARFGIAAGGVEKERKIYFSGGSENPAAPLGMGFDGKPAEPSAMTFAYDLRAAKWLVVNENTPKPIMQSRGLLETPTGLAIVGGMEEGQKVISRVPLLPFAAKAP